MKKILSALVFIFILFSFAHPFYLSVTDLKYSTKEGTFQGTVKIFTNDLEVALKRSNKKTIDLLHPIDTVQTKKILEDYLFKHLQLSADNKVLKFDLLGFEQEDGATWLYIETKNCQLPEQLTVTNSILYDFIRTQSNIVHVEVNGNRQSSKANYPDREMNFKLR